MVLSELQLIANSSYKGFETEKLHLLFQATYFLNTGNYKSALRFYQELIELFHDNEQRMLNPPIHYFNALKGILESLQLAGLCHEMPYFIDKVRSVESGTYSEEFLLSVRAYLYLSEFSYRIHSGNVDLAKQLRENYQESLLSKISLLDFQLQLKLHLNSTIFALLIGEPKEALRSLKKILGAGKSFSNFPDYKVARLVNLLVQAELGNYDYIESEINSLKRDIVAEKSLYQFKTEKLLFRFTKYFPLPSDQKVKRKIWEKLHKEIDIIRDNHYERPLLKTFDFTAWIESKLTERPFIETIKGSRT